MPSREIPLERMLGAELRVVQQAIVQRIGQALAAAGFEDLRPAHFAVFRSLPAEPVRLTDLAERAQVTKQSMGALVEHLVAHGYLERAPDPHDRRAQLLRRTARGWEVERVARATIRALEREWAAALGAERYATFRDTLRDLVELLEHDGPSSG